MPDVPPPYLRFMRPKKPLYVTMREYEDISPTTTIDIETVVLSLRRLSGFSVEIGYWPDSWQDQWAIDELLEWEWPGWKNEKRFQKEKYYADFIVDENQQARENERRQIESKSVPAGQQSVVLVVHESVHRRGVDSGPNVLGRAESDNYLRLERGVSGGYAGDISGEDGS